MTTELRKAFDAEMRAAASLYETGEFAVALRHLETAHVLVQEYVRPHVATHHSMLKFGLKRMTAWIVAVLGLE